MSAPRLIVPAIQMAGAEDWDHSRGKDCVPWYTLLNPVFPSMEGDSNQCLLVPNLTVYITLAFITLYNTGFHYTKHYTETNPSVFN